MRALFVQVVAYPGCSVMELSQSGFTHTATRQNAKGFPGSVKPFLCINGM